MKSMNFRETWVGRICRKVRKWLASFYLGELDWSQLRRQHVLTGFAEGLTVPVVAFRVLDASTKANRPRKQLESSAPLGFAASGIFLR